MTFYFHFLSLKCKMREKYGNDVNADDHLVGLELTR